MKKIIKIFLISIFILLSMYETNNILEQLKEKDPIMQEIKKTSKKYKIESVNAQIIENTIIPGIYGKDIDYNTSYSMMKKYGTYNESLTKIIDVQPSISIGDNKDKYIIKGNEKNKNISIIIKLNKKINIDNLVNILNKTNTQVTLFIDGTLLENNLNDIRKLSSNELEILSYDNKYDEIFFKTSISYLNQITSNKRKFCYTEKENPKLLKLCSKEKMYTIKSPIINKNLLKEVKYSLENGKIYVIENDNYSELLSTIKYIKSKGYKLVTLENLLNEKVC